MAACAVGRRPWPCTGREGLEQRADARGSDAQVKFEEPMPRPDVFSLVGAAGRAPPRAMRAWNRGRGPVVCRAGCLCLDWCRVSAPAVLLGARVTRRYAQGLDLALVTAITVFSGITCRSVLPCGGLGCLLCSMCALVPASLYLQFLSASHL